MKALQEKGCIQYLLRVESCKKYLFINFFHSLLKLHLGTGLTQRVKSQFYTLAGCVLRVAAGSCN